MTPADRRAVTHALGMDMLEATGVHAVRARVVDDGDLVSVGGVTSGLDLGLCLVEREYGPKVARAVETLFEFERRGTVRTDTGREALAV
jgi:transcriptional regulator GlxA family with amidase domain